jgi:hypothetical protein
VRHIGLLTGSAVQQAGGWYWAGAVGAAVLAELCVDGAQCPSTLQREHFGVTCAAQMWKVLRSVGGRQWQLLTLIRAPLRSAVPLCTRQEGMWVMVAVMPPKRISNSTRAEWGPTARVEGVQEGEGVQAELQVRRLAVWLQLGAVLLRPLQGRVQVLRLDLRTSCSR